MLDAMTPEQMVVLAALLEGLAGDPDAAIAQAMVTKAARDQIGRDREKQLFYTALSWMYDADGELDVHEVER